jgi:hypothetical protein
MPATVPNTMPAGPQRLIRCDICWAPPGEPCQRQPAGDHLARLITAVKLGLLSRDQLAAVVGGLTVIADHVVIIERAA